MSYSRSIEIQASMSEADTKTREALKAQGFGILTEIDVQATLKTKLDHDMSGYKILGACNPKMAQGAIALEPRIGLMLPCNVILRELEGGKVEVSAIDPVASMAAIDNPALMQHAASVKVMLDKALDSLQD